MDEECNSVENGLKCDGQWNRWNLSKAIFYKLIENRILWDQEGCVQDTKC